MESILYLQELYLKAIHIVFIVTWFAGLFYIVRLFIYHTEAQFKPEEEKSVLQAQYKIMEKRLWYGITWPSMIASIIIGIWLATIKGLWLSPWFHIKLTIAAALVVYHLQCGRIYQQLKNDAFSYSSNWLRVWNEIATLLLVALVFTAVLKNSLNWIWGLFGLSLIALVIWIGIVVYRYVRTRINK